MNDNPSPTQNNRLLILLLLTIAIVVGALYAYKKYDAYQKAVIEAEAARQAALKKLNLEFSNLVDTKWSLNDVQIFLQSRTQSDLNKLGELTGKSGGTAEQLAYHLLWLSSSAFTYPFKDKNKVDYHTEILRWAAEKNGVFAADGLSSFRIERRILEFKFAQIWDRLNPQQRTELLNKMKVSGFSDNQKTALVAGTGAAALTALSATVAFSGFAFYTTMSTVMATTAGFFGVTLPFSAYMGASSTACFLSGPVGWSIALVAGTGAAVWAAAPNADKTTAFIVALHALKASQAAEIAEKIQKLGGTVPVI